MDEYLKFSREAEIWLMKRADAEKRKAEKARRVSSTNKSKAA